MGDTEWLEISVRVGGETAEAVAEVLSRYIESGVVIEKEAPGKDDDQPSDDFKVYAYIPEDERLSERREKIEKGLWHLGQLTSIPQPEFRSIKNQNWMEAWREHFHPLEVGQRFQVLPAWRKEERTPGRETILIEPGMGFGTGTHPTTQLSMVLIERYLKPGDSMIDVGTGSGILAAAGAKLGAGDILAVDVDIEAVRAAAETFRLNECGEKIELGRGSVAEIRAGDHSLEKAKVVAANILAKILLILFEEGLTDLVEDGGILILSGILEEKEPEIKEALEKAKFKTIDRVQERDWVALAAVRNGG